LKAAQVWLKQPLGLATGVPRTKVPTGTLGILPQL
jgi:hypothetical protein